MVTTFTVITRPVIELGVNYYSNSSLYTIHCLP
jgi:hypothetical protein